MNKISAQSLGRAALLSKEIETLHVELDSAQSVVLGLNNQISPLQQELNSIMGYKACKASGSRRFSPEQRAKISAGLKAKWAERKATAADASFTLAPVNA